MDVKQYQWRAMSRAEQQLHTHYEDTWGDNAVLRGVQVPVRYRYYNGRGAGGGAGALPRAVVALQERTAATHALKFLKAKAGDGVGPAAAGGGEGKGRGGQRRQRRYFSRREAAKEWDRDCARERFLAPRGSGGDVAADDDVDDLLAAGTAARPSTATTGRAAAHALLAAMRVAVPSSREGRPRRKRRFDDANAGGTSEPSAAEPAAKRARQTESAARTPAAGLGFGDVMWFDDAPTPTGPKFKVRLYSDDEDSESDADDNDGTGARDAAHTARRLGGRRVTQVTESWNDYVLRRQGALMKRARERAGEVRTWVAFAALQEFLHGATPYTYGSGGNGGGRPYAKRALFERKLAILDEGLAKCGDRRELWEEMIATADAFLPTGLVEDVWEEYLRRCGAAADAWCGFVRWKHREYTSLTIPALREILVKAQRWVSAARYVSLSAPAARDATPTPPAQPEAPAAPPPPAPVPQPPAWHPYDAHAAGAGYAPPLPPHPGYYQYPHPPPHLWHAAAAAYPPLPPDAYPQPLAHAHAQAYVAVGGYPGYYGEHQGMHGGFGGHVPTPPPPPPPPGPPPQTPPPAGPTGGERERGVEPGTGSMVVPGPSPPVEAAATAAESPAPHDVFALEEGLVRLLDEAAWVEASAGYAERAVALYQAAVGVNVLPPPTRAAVPPSRPTGAAPVEPTEESAEAWDDRLAAYMAYWDGEGVRVGEGGGGAAACSLPSSAPPASLAADASKATAAGVDGETRRGGGSNEDEDVEALIGKVQPRRVYTAWVTEETRAHQHEWSPCRPVRDRAAAQRDPDRAVLSSDIADLIPAVHDPRNQRLLVALFLEQLGFPLLYYTHPWEHALVHDLRTRRALDPLVFTDVFDLIPAFDDGADADIDPAPPATQAPTTTQVPPSTYTRILDWAPRYLRAQSEGAPAAKAARVAFIEEIIRECTRTQAAAGAAPEGPSGAGVFDVHEADRLVLELYAAAGPTGSGKEAPLPSVLDKGKALLALPHNRRGDVAASIPLWTRYAEIAGQEGQHALRDKLYGTLLKMSGGGVKAALAKRQGDAAERCAHHLAAVCSYVEAVVATPVKRGKAGTKNANDKEKDKGNGEAAAIDMRPLANALEGAFTECAGVEELVGGCVGEGASGTKVVDLWDEATEAEAVGVPTRQRYMRVLTRGAAAVLGGDDVNDASLAVAVGVTVNAARAAAWWEVLAHRSVRRGCAVLLRVLVPLEAAIERRQRNTRGLPHDHPTLYAADVHVPRAVEALWRALAAVAALPTLHPQRVLRYQPDEVLDLVQAGALRYPTHPVFAALYVSLQRRHGRRQPVQVFFAKLLRAAHHAPLAVVAVADAERRVMRAAARARAVLERGCDGVGGRGCAVLWVAWMRLEAGETLPHIKSRDAIEARQRELDAALAAGEKVTVRRRMQKELDGWRAALERVRGVFFRGIADVPGCVAVWVAGVRELHAALLPRELQDAVDMMHEKELHVRVFVEEMV